MENLQRQQAARLALEEKLRQGEKDNNLFPMVESQNHQQALAFRHYQMAMRGALAAGVGSKSPGVTLPHMDIRRSYEDRNSTPDGADKERGEEEQNIMPENQEDGDDLGLNQYQDRLSSHQGACLTPKSATVNLMARVPTAFAFAHCAESPASQRPSQHHEWTYEEQFKQVRQLTLPHTL